MTGVGKWVVIAIVLYLISIITIICAVIYTIVHFIAKFW